MGLGSLWETPKYTVQGSLVFTPLGLGGEMGLLAAMGESPLALEAEMAILRSRAIVAPVLEEEGLDEVKRVFSNPFTRLNEHAKAHLRLVDPPQYARLGTESNFGVISEVDSTTRAPDEALEDFRDNGHFAIAGVPSRSITPSSAGIITVTLEAADPFHAQRILEGILNDFLALHLAWRSDKGQVISTFIQGQIDALKTELETAESALQAFRESTEVFSVSAEAQTLASILLESEKENRRLRIEAAQLDAMLSALAEGAPAEDILGALDIGGTQFADFETSPGLDFLGQTNSLAMSLAELERQDRVLALTMTPQHPQRIALSEGIRTRREQLLSSLRNSRDRLNEMMSAGDEIQSEYEVQLASLPGLSTQAVRLMRDVEILTATYTFLLQKSKEMEISTASTVSRTRILESPVIIPEPSSPSPKLRAVLALFFGFLSALGGVFLAEARANRPRPTPSPPPPSS